MDKFLTKRPREEAGDSMEKVGDSSESKTPRTDPLAAGSSDVIKPTTLPELAVLEHLDTESPWREALRKEFGKSYMREMDDKLSRERKSKTIFPQPEHVFACLNFTPLSDVRVVILGQDPYHGPGQVLCHETFASQPVGIAL